MRCHCAGSSVSAAAPASAERVQLARARAREHADGHGALGVEIAAEAAGKVHAVHLLRCDAALLQQHADARRDGGLGQL